MKQHLLFAGTMCSINDSAYLLGLVFVRELEEKAQRVCHVLNTNNKCFTATGNLASLRQIGTTRRAGM